MLPGTALPTITTARLGKFHSCAYPSGNQIQRTSFINTRSILPPPHEAGSGPALDPAKTRDDLKAFLQEQGIPAMIYYPVPLYEQPAFAQYWKGGRLPVTEALCASVFSLPMHSEMTEDILARISGAVKAFFEASQK